MVLLEPEKNSNQTLKDKALVDTGFDGFLCISIDLAMAMKLKVIKQQETFFGNGESEINKVVLIKIQEIASRKVDYTVEAILTRDQETVVGCRLLQVLAEDFGVEMVINFLIPQLRFDKV